MTDSLSLSLFEFIVGMISVILALAIAEMFLGAARLVENRARVRFSWTHGVWIVNLFLITFLHWWSLWTLRELSWNFGMFFYSLMAPSLMFFAATVICPRNVTDAKIDLAAYYFDIRRPFLGVVVAVFAFSIFDGPLFGTEPLFNGLRGVQGLILALPAWGFFAESRKIQSAVAFGVFAGLCANVVMRFIPGQ